ncbi:hypothetical protein PROFUN_12816 [Planoprotostelium fungivorum]|uniref:Pre-PUA domain-containing protein n=1 Tax=Planoprotostelium fungivorum TaxID=1890364 RepID=A0A2P6N6N8_9EUKA|nr:hypothetical protein PROFUN_12816 [Planoprotostelium fungivorum]
MFKKFTKDEDVASQSLVKSSVSRGIRNNLLEQMDNLDAILDQLLPKSKQLIIAKCSNHITLITCENEILFFNERDDPNILPHVQVDRGAIKFEDVFQKVSQLEQ